MENSKDNILAIANNASKNTLMETLGIEICDVGVDFLIARMPVTSKVYQPDGVLHGGATAALAESVGSFAAHIFIDAQKYFVRGIDISCNHLKSVSNGFVYARADFMHKGRTTQLFDIKVTDEEGNLISVCKLPSTVTQNDL